MTTDQQQPPAPVDAWRSAFASFEADQRRIRSMYAQSTDPVEQAAAAVAREVGSTVMSYVKDLHSFMVEFRDLTQPWLVGLTDHVENIEGAVREILDDEVDRFTDEDLGDISRLADGAVTIAEQFLERSQGLPERGRQELADFIALAKKVRARVAEVQAEEEDDDEAEDNGAAVGLLKGAP